MNLIEKMIKEPVFIEGDGYHFRTEPKDNSFEVYKKMNGEETKLQDHSDESFSKTVAGYGFLKVITKEEYEKAN